MPIFTTATRCLVEVIEAGSIRRAAEILNMAPSAINRHILNLEAEYGTMFLERLPRGVRATPAGEIMVDQIRQWQNGLAGVTDTLAKLRGKQRQHISIGMMECFAGSFFAVVLEEVRKSFPDMTVQVRVGGTKELTNALKEGRIDLLLCFNVPPSSDYWAVETLPIGMGIVVPPGHPFASRKSVTLPECQSQDLLLVDDSLSLRRMIETMFAGAAVGPTSPLTSNSIIMIKRAVEAGTGISILTRFDVRDELASGTLAFIPLDSSNMRESLSICMRDQSSATPLEEAFQGAILSALRKDLVST